MIANVVLLVCVSFVGRRVFGYHLLFMCVSKSNSLSSKDHCALCSLGKIVKYLTVINIHTLKDSARVYVVNLVNSVQKGRFSLAALHAVVSALVFHGDRGPSL